MGFSTSTCTEFVEVLASKAPVPGGGGASAIGGAIGNGLGWRLQACTIPGRAFPAQSLSWRPGAESGSV